MRPAGPVPTADRIDTLDVLRGFALLGMFVVHFHMRSTEPGGVDDVIRTLIWRLIETKSHGAFALLFGAGFAIQLRRANARGEPFVQLYVRRLAVLAAFGFAAHAFFGYNVLLGYAVWGLALLAVRRWNTRTLLATAAVSAISVPLYYLAVTLYLLASSAPAGIEAFYDAQQAAATDVNALRRAAEAQGSYAVLLAARARHMAWFYTRPFFFMPGATLTLFIAGLLMVRHRVFEEPAAHNRLLAWMAGFGIIAWLADNWGLPAIHAGSAGLLRDQWLTFAYVAAFLAILARHPQMTRRLRTVGNAGRMALTNYLIQIAALDLLFSGYAFGLPDVRPAAGLVAALVCFAAETAFSTWWLGRYRFGPAEWLWRSLTYGRAQPLRRSLGAGVTAAV